MTRTEIKRIAKNIVANHGPYQVLDSAMLFAENEIRYSQEFYSLTEGQIDKYVNEISDEAITQSYRVIDFLGL